MRIVFHSFAALGLAVCALALSGCTPAAVETAGSDVTTESSGDASDAEAASVESSEPAIGDPPPSVESDSTTGDAPASETPAPATDDPAAAPSNDPAPGEAASEPAAALTPVAITDGVAALSGENTKIQFTGTHAGDKPDPRVGTFGKFTGEARIDAAAKTLQSVTVEIDMTSITTAFPKLTDHLQSPDFFEVQEFPTAKFESTEIGAADGGQVTIKGNLTLHGVTKEISFPANVQVTDEGLTVHSDFSINRSEFGMDFSTDKVDDKVSMSVVVGEKTPTP